MHPYPREPTEYHAARECLEKTLVVEQYLLPLLQHLDVPNQVLVEFKRRWRKANLAGKNFEALLAIAHRHHITIPVHATEDSLRALILDAESQ